MLPVKGASVYGKPVITMPKTRNQRGVYLCEVGTDTAKEILYARMKADPTPADEATSYAYAALRVSVQRWQLDLAVLAKSREEETTRPTLKELAAKLSGGVNGYSR